MMRHIYIYAIFLLFNGLAFGQDAALPTSKSVVIEYINSHPKFPRKELQKIVVKSADSQQITQLVHNIKAVAFAAGFVHVLVDLATTDQAHLILITPNQPLYWKEFRTDSLPPNVRNLLNLPQENDLVQPFEINSLVADGLLFLENTGYPFARFYFDDLQIFEDSLSASLRIKTGPLYHFDSVVVKGVQIPDAMLRLQLGIKKGQRYNEAVLRRVQQRAEGIPYIAVPRAPQFLFEKEKGTVFLYIENRKSSQFDGLVGLNTAEDGAITLNGDLNLRLLNALKKGEDFRINWRSPNAGVQQLATSLEVPYIFKTPLGFKIDFNLFRQDSSWSNRNFGFEVAYQIAAGTFINVGLQNARSAVLQAAATPGQGNVRSQSLQTGVTIRQLNDPLLPTKGLMLQLRIGQGFRVLENSSLQMRQGHLEGQYFYPLAKRHNIFSRVMAGGIFSDDLFVNELHRLGGFKSLRGFNELSLFAANYGLMAFEYRFFLERYSYLVAFFDAGILNNPTAIIPELTAMGTGVGLNFRTGGGIFSLAFAVGRTPNQAFDLRLAKVHVGFVNEF
jgi:outer membrane protein insertion porin family